MYVELGGLKIENNFELVGVKLFRKIKYFTITLHGSDFKDMEEGSRQTNDNH